MGLRLCTFPGISRSSHVMKGWLRTVKMWTEWLICSSPSEQLGCQSTGRQARESGRPSDSPGGPWGRALELFTVPLPPNQNTRPPDTGLPQESLQRQQIQECEPAEPAELRNSVPVGTASSGWTVTTTGNTCEAILFWKETHHQGNYPPTCRFLKLCFDFKEGESGCRYFLSSAGGSGVSF